MSYERIMVAIDGSDTSDLALMEAVTLTKTLRAKLCIVYAADIYPLYALSLNEELVKYSEMIKINGHAILAKAKETAQKHGVFVEIQLLEIRSISKKVSEKIVEAAESWHADLLILGTHGYRGFRRFMLGSVAEETLRIVPIPVLLVRANKKISPHMSYKRILVAVDGSEISHLALVQAIYLRDKLQATLCILHVANEIIAKDLLFTTELDDHQKSIKKSSNDILKKMKQTAEEYPGVVETLLLEINTTPTSITDKIIEATQSYKADLLVIGTHGYRGFNRFLLGSIAEETIRATTVPVLVIRAKNPNPISKIKSTDNSTNKSASSKL